MPDRSLDVWLLGSRVGRIDQEAGRLVFTYDADWLARPSAAPLSASLPLRPEPFDDRAARPFFAGLLPEQEKRDQVARALGVSARNDFALLDGIGGECAGAVTFTHPGEKPVDRPSMTDYRLLENKELAEILDKLPDRPLLAGEKEVRLSLAGAQDKLPVLVVNGQVSLPLHGAPSSHILKPPIRRIEDSVYNEGFCLALAKSLGLDVVPAEIREADGRPYLLVARYDRITESDPRRVHQEDFCQALGVAPELKYQNEGGPSLADCFALVRKATKPPAVYLLQLLDAVIFNVLVANHDAHGKNYSLVYEANGTKLAPLYDVLCTAAYADLTPKMAMKIGGHYEFKDVFPRHWEQLAREAGLSAPQVRRRLLELAERLPAAAEALHDRFQNSGLARPVIGRIIDIVQQRCILTRDRFKEARIMRST
jgi:serine/threonine-protein kinase HipA